MVRLNEEFTPAPSFDVVACHQHHPFRMPPEDDNSDLEDNLDLGINIEE